MSCPTLQFFSVRDRTIGVGLCKCKQNKLFIFLFNNQIYDSLITLAIERKPFELFGYKLYPIWYKIAIKTSKLYPIRCKMKNFHYICGEPRILAAPRERK